MNFSILRSGFQEKLPGNIGPQASEPHIQHINGAPDGAALQDRLRDGKADQGSGVQLWAYSRKINGAAGKPGTGIGVHIPPIEGIAFTGVGKPVHPLVNLTNLPDAVQADDMGEGAVVRGDNILSGVRFGNNALPV